MSIFIKSQEYEIIEELGEGGNGKVYQVFNKKENKYYAIKSVRIKNLTEEQVNIIENEAKLLSSIDSIYVVKYYNSSRDNENFNILMEYCKGSDLKKFIIDYKNKNEFINEKIIEKIILGLCLGVKEIHKNNLIHRDLKPENIFINKEYEVKIGDFGIAKKLDFNNKYANTSIGTNNYMSPEVIKGENYNTKVDIWGIGCILYELLTLNICFESKSIYGFVDKIINKPHGKINSNIYSFKWQKLIDLLLEKEYKKRPDIDELLKLLKNLKEKKTHSYSTRTSKIITEKEFNIKKKK